MSKKDTINFSDAQNATTPSESTAKRSALKAKMRAVTLKLRERREFADEDAIRNYLDQIRE